MGVCLRVDELRDHSYLVASAPHAPFEDSVDAQLFRDLRDRLVLVSVLQDRRPRDNRQITDLGQLREDVLVDARREELVLRIRTQVVERQHRNRFPGCRIVERKPASEQA